MTKHVMIDIETLGTGNYAAIIAIGAVKFDPWASPSELTDSFYVRVDAQSAMDVGMRVDGSTIDWWMAEGRDEARKALMSSPAVDLIEALYGFNEWFGADSLPTWGNGATFDNVIMDSAFKLTRVPKPWNYKHDRCYRTLKSIAPDVSVAPIGVAHHALGDAMHQAATLQQIVHVLGLKHL